MSPLTFVELASSAGHEAIEIVFESGTRIRVPSGFDASTLARVVAVLEHR